MDRKNQEGIIELIVLGVLAVTAFTGVGAVVLSKTAAPGDILFPVKQATEQAQLGLAVDDKGKAAAHLNILKHKQQEIQKLADRNAPADIIEAEANELLENEQETSDKLASAKSKGQDVNELENELENEQQSAAAVLKKVRTKAPEAAHKGLDHAIEMVEKHKEASDAGTSGKKPTGTPGAPSTTTETHSGSGATAPTTSGTSGKTTTESGSGTTESGSGSGGSGSGSTSTESGSGGTSTSGRDSTSGHR